MRTPHVIDFNTHLVYDRSSMTTLATKFQNEREAENEGGVVEKLTTLVLKAIARNIKKHMTIINKLMQFDQDHLFELISTDLDMNFAVSSIENHHYWQRRFRNDFGPNVEQKHLGWTWKCLYLEQYVQKICEEVQYQHFDEAKFISVLELCAPYVHTLIMGRKSAKTSSLPTERPRLYRTNFVTVLNCLPNITRLEIRHDIDSNYNTSVEDCEMLGEAIQHLPHLKVLHLHRTGVVCEHIRGLVYKLFLNTSLVELDLSYCKIGDVGAKYIALLLRVHDNLKILNLKGNRIQEQGAIRLARSLLNPVGAHLHRLDLSLNPLCHEGTMVLLSALVRRVHLQDLSLAACQMSDSTALRVGKMLSINSALRVLDVSNNQFGYEGGMVLLESMRINKKLCFLNLTETNIPDRVLVEIEEMLKRNRSLNSIASKEVIDLEIKKYSSDIVEN